MMEHKGKCIKFWDVKEKELRLKTVNAVTVL